MTLLTKIKNFLIFENIKIESSHETLLHIWRERIFTIIFFSTIIIGTPPYLITTIDTFKKGWWSNFALYTFIYVSLFILVLIRKIPFKLRAWIGTSIFYLLGISGLIFFGMLGSGRIYLCTFSITVCLLIGLRGGIISLILNISSIIIIICLRNNGIFDSIVRSPTQTDFSLIFIITFTWLNTITTLSLGIMVNVLEQILKTKQDFIGKLNRINEKMKAEITKRKEAEELIVQNLHEKETLLKELYHRTKNNMNVIISMLSMHDRKLNNPELRSIIKDIKFKVNSMALVHQKLYQSKDLSKINIKDYIIDLANSIKSAYNTKGKDIKIHFDIENIFFLIDTAIPLGLITNELITNAFKYAWPENSTGNLHISLKRDNEEMKILIIEDDGVGLKENFDLDKNKNLGLEIATMLGEKQMNGEINCINSNGVIWKLKFNDNLYSKRV